jgi:hypothetical protein
MSENLSQFGRRLREHLKEHRPKMYAELGRSSSLYEYFVSQQQLDSKKRLTRKGSDLKRPKRSEA